MAALPDAPKPPYRVPTMDEVRAVPDCGLRTVSLFTGAGGSCCGLRMAGFHTLWANEFVPAARETYRANWPQTLLDERDVRTIQPSEILEACGLRRGELDVLEGSPPCASFSMAGKRQRGWGQVREYSDTAQRADDLFFEYARLLRGLQPRVFVAENVGGLVRGVAKGYFIEILHALRESGYRVEARLLDAQWLGVPQSRARLFFIGVRADLAPAPAFPAPLPYRYSVRDALPHILAHGSAPPHAVWEALGRDPERTMRDSRQEPAPTITAAGPDKGAGLVRVIHDTGGIFGRGDVTDRPCPTITVGTGSVNSAHYRVVEDISGYAIGEEWDKLAPGERSTRYHQLQRADPDAPCATVTGRGGGGGVATVTHPTERRKFTIDELKAICSFPPDYVLTGSYAQAWERCGRAVPPVMMAHVGRALRDHIFAHLAE